MGGVLLTDGSQSAWPALEERYGLPASATERLWYEELQQPADLGEIGEDQIWSRICSLQPGLSASDVRQVFLDQYIPLPEGVLALEAAHLAGWQVLLATNNVNSWVDYWTRMYDWMRLPERVICSADLGIRKPDGRFFEAVLAVASGNPVYFVDDKPENLAPAKAQGLEVVLAHAGGDWDLPAFTT